LKAQITFLNQGTLYVADSLFIDGHFQAEKASEVFQMGKTVLTGDINNNVTSGHVFTETDSKNTGTFEFRGTAGQHIKGSANKARYINFPATLRINNQAATDSLVTMHPEQAATVQTLNIQRGRLILDAATAGDRASINAHLLVKGNVTNRVNSIQVNLALGANHNNRGLAGFTPPFENMYADYFFFNFLSRPTATGLFGNDGRLIVDPRTSLKPGYGYIIGMGVVTDPNYYATELDPRWSDAQYSKRATTKFYFSRAVAEPSYNKYVKDQPDAVSGEKLVTQNISIQLEKGFNYFGNPYMTPLDLSDIAEGNTTDWGGASIKHGFYVLSQGTGSYDSQTKQFTFSPSYLKTQKVGSTTTGNTTVAPMQMFIIGSNGTGTFKIPASKRIHDGTSTFLRSAPDEVVDELLIETTDDVTKGYDRLCIVFRPDAHLSSGDRYDAVKIFNRSGGVNQIYTRSADEQDMTVSVVPPGTGKLTMYFAPALLPQQVTLRADRLNSLASVYHVFLEDTKTQTLTDLLREPTYTFTSAPSDKTDRFVIHFTSNPSTGTDLINTPAPQARYEGGVLRIFGLKENDRGSDVSLFNMQGQLLHRQALTETAPCEIRQYLPRGVYMVKNNSTVIKFAVQ
jgi:hypothetical protein